MLYVMSFSQIKPEHMPLVGLKGMNLSILSKEFNVPHGFVLTLKAFDYFLMKTFLKARIENLLASLSDANIQRSANEIQKMIMETDFPDDIKKEVTESYEALDFEKSAALNDLIATNIEVSVAVRSSYIKEYDTKHLSHLTFLNISGEQRLLNSIKICYAALFTAKNLKERMEKGTLEEIGTAVVVQKMIESDASIVSYSFNPNTKNHDEIYLSAVFGLGEAFTINDTAFDVYIADKNSMEIKSVVVTEQKVMHKLDPSIKKTKAVNLGDTGKKQKLSEQEMIMAAEITKQVSSWFEFEQKVELAIKDGKFYVLQSKNIAKKAKIATPEEIIIEKIETKEESQKTKQRKDQKKEKKQKPKKEAEDDEPEVFIDEELWPEDMDFLDIVEREVEKYQTPLRKEPKKADPELRKYKFGKYDETEDLKKGLKKQEEAEPEEDYEMEEDEKAQKRDKKKKQEEEKEEKTKGERTEEDDSIFSSMKDK